MIQKLFNAVLDGVLMKIDICHVDSEDRVYRRGEDRPADATNVRLELYATEDVHIGYTFDPKTQSVMTDEFKQTVREMLSKLRVGTQDSRLLEIADGL